MNFDYVRQNLRGNEFESLKALGVTVPLRANQGGVCPNCGGHDRFSWIISDGKWLYNCRHCGGGDCFNLVTKLCGNNPKRASEVLTCTTTHQFQAAKTCNQVAYSSRNAKAENQDKAACLAQSIWESTVTRTDHFYLESRGIQNLEVDVLSEVVTTGGVLFDAGSIVVPLFDGDKLVNVQLINDCGDKRYLKDGKKSGCSHILLAESPTEIYVCEGYATAITVWLALEKKQLVAVAFDAGNIPNVADSLRELKLPLVFMADNDKVGIDKAKQAAIDGDQILIPPFKPGEQGTDWDDYRQLGYDVATVIVEAKQPTSSTRGEMFIAAGSLSFPDLNSNAKPIGTCANLSALVNYLGYIPAQNAMNLELEMLKDGKPVDSSLESKRSYLISECLKSGLPKSVIDDHLMALCERNKYHPVKAYLDNEVWDGIKRIDSLIEAMNPKDMRIAKAVMTKWLVACVAALYESHFSCKIVPILQGGQSFKKTAFISRFANVVPGAYSGPC